MTDSIVNHSPWPASMVAKLGDDALSVVTQVKRARSRDEMLSILEPFDLTDDELAIAYTKIGTSVISTTPEPTSNTLPNRMDAKVLQISKTKFYAACWYCGAAYRQVGRLMGVSHQTVYTMTGRIIGVNPVRVNPNSITDEQLAAFHRDWLLKPYQSIEECIVSFLHILENWRE